MTPHLHVNCCGGGGTQIISVPNCLLFSTVVSSGDLSRPIVGLPLSEGRREGGREGGRRRA